MATSVQKASLTVGMAVRILDARPDLDLPVGAHVVVKDLMDRPTYDKPNYVGVGPASHGLAFSVELNRIELMPASLETGILASDLAKKAAAHKPAAKPAAKEAPAPEPTCEGMNPPRRPRGPLRRRGTRRPRSSACPPRPSSPSWPS
jgi:hypothetical protein